MPVTTAQPAVPTPTPTATTPTIPTQATLTSALLGLGGNGGLTFEDGMGLVAIAIKNRHPMPASDEPVAPETVVFTPRTRLPRARSLLILPLVHGEQILGSITLASARERLFPADARAMLRVISNQVAVSLQNARMYASMEERATTDGLTGLTNHRAFQERFAGLHALAERRGGKLAVILTDIDHFKKINDTYGHPVGDAVLKRVAAIFTGRSRYSSPASIRTSSGLHTARAPARPCRSASGPMPRPSA